MSDQLEVKQRVFNRKTTRPVGNGSLGKESFQAIEEKKEKHEQPPAHQQKESTTEEDYRNAYKFSLDELQDAWNDVATLLTGGKKSLYYTMINGKLELDNENFVVTITVRNKLQVDEIKESRKKIVDILRRKLDNKLLQLRIKEENNPQTKKPYTTKEKYEHMVKKNPVLKDLRDKLGLDTNG